MADRPSPPALLLAALLAVPVFALEPSAAMAEQKKFVADYTVSLYGLTLARTSFTSTLDGDAITIDGTVASAGVARIIDDTKGTTTVRGPATVGRGREVQLPPVLGRLVR